jgi:hypothetical protein
VKREARKGWRGMVPSRRTGFLGTFGPSRDEDGVAGRCGYPLPNRFLGTFGPSRDEDGVAGRCGYPLPNRFLGTFGLGRGLDLNAFGGLEKAQTTLV